MNKCKRMTVYAYANGYSARNGNDNECTNIPGQCGCTHAEINLLKIVPNPKEVHITHSPCLNCAKALFIAGTKLVTYDESYRLTEGVEYLKANGVIVEQTNDYLPTRLEGSD